MIRTALGTLTLALLVSAPAGVLKAEEETKPMTIKRITTNLYADEIEPCIQFWERMGFEKVKDVPAGNKLAFAMLQKGNLELMYGTYSSLAQDPDVAKAFQKGTTYLFVEVENLDDVIPATTGAEIVKAKHQTFYGSTEISVKDPAGHIVTFAQFGVKQ
ncbi:MAG TPA: VOC family protein [Bryobacteraceae bacterium]|nr:VOC family protein [Bryobacteraceae bacterium]